jgi:hypothetical protein
MTTFLMGSQIETVFKLFSLTSRSLEFFLV